MSYFFNYVLKDQKRSEKGLCSKLWGLSINLPHWVVFQTVRICLQHILIRSRLYFFCLIPFVFLICNSKKKKKKNYICPGPLNYCTTHVIFPIFLALRIAFSGDLPFRPNFDGVCRILCIKFQFFLIYLSHMPPVSLSRYVVTLVMN